MAWYQMIGKNKIRFFLHEQFDPLRSWQETGSKGLLRREEEYETCHPHPAFGQLFCSNARVFTYTAVKPGEERICFTFAHRLDPEYDLNSVDFSMVIEPDLSIRVYEHGELLKGLYFYHFLHQKPRLTFSFCGGRGDFALIKSEGTCLEPRYIHREEHGPSCSMPGESTTPHYDLCGVHPGQTVVRFYSSDLPEAEPVCTVIAAFTVLDDLSVRLDGMIEPPKPRD